MKIDIIANTKGDTLYVVKKFEIHSEEFDEPTKEWNVISKSENRDEAVDIMESIMMTDNLEKEEKKKNEFKVIGEIKR